MNKTYFAIKISINVTNSRVSFNFTIVSQEDTNCADVS